MNAIEFECYFYEILWSSPYLICIPNKEFLLLGIPHIKVTKELWKELGSGRHIDAPLELQTLKHHSPEHNVTMTLSSVSKGTHLSYTIMKIILSLFSSGAQNITMTLAALSLICVTLFS